MEKSCWMPDARAATPSPVPGKARIQPRRRFAPCPVNTPLTSWPKSLAEGLSVGHPDMPEFVFEPDDITAILAYLNSIQEQ